MSLHTAFSNHGLSQFLQKRITKSSAEATLTGMGEYKCKCAVADADYPEFLDLMHDYLFVQKKRPMNFVEQPKQDGAKPLLIDLDFRYPADQAINRTFDTPHIKAFIGNIARALHRFFDLTAYEYLRFFVTLRHEPYQDTKSKKIKDGIHIMCPDIGLVPEKQKVIRTWLLKENAVSTAFRPTGYENSDKEVYDESMVRKQGWFFYGESKPNIPAYQLTHVIHYNPETRELEDGEPVDYTPRELLELLSVRYAVQADDNTVRPEMLPEYMTLAEKKPTAPPTPGAVGVNQEQAAVNTQNLLAAVAQLLPSVAAESDIEWDLYKGLIGCLTQERAEGYDDWMRVGWCLHNISPSEEMFDLWMEFSEKSSKFSKNNISELRHTWDTMRDKNSPEGRVLTERSLHRWAREDNPQLYAKIVENNLHEYIRKKLDKTHYTIATLMEKMFGNDYVASVNQKTIDWYIFDRTCHAWRHMNQGMALRLRIVSHVASEINAAAEKVRAMYATAKDDSTRELFQKKLKELHGIVGHLYTSGFKDGVMKECTMLFSQEDFTSKLNMNPFLFGCANGVLELRPEVVFRDGKPEDMSSFLAGNNAPDNEAIYYREYDPADPNIPEIMDFFEKIFPRADLRRYAMRLLASCLEGKNREQQYYTFSGVGGNGKSKLIELMRLTLGDYQSSMQSTVLTRPRPSSGSANPELMAIKNKRFIYMAEPDDKEPLNTSCMKQFSGEDVIEARGLFQDQEKFKVSGKLFMLCNRLPPIHSMDRGTWRRIRVLPFEALFVDPDAPELNSGRPYVYLRDNSLDEKLIKWRESFLSLLVHIYKTEYAVEGLGPEPEIVIRESGRYKEAFDSFAKFRSQRMRRAMGRQATMKEMMKIYGAWFAEQGGETGKKVKAQEFSQRLTDEFRNDFDGKVISNYVVFEDDAEVEEFDAEENMMAEEGI